MSLVYSFLTKTLLLPMLMVVLLLSMSLVDALPSGFIAEPVSSAYAIAGTFATNPRNDNKPMMIVVEKTGRVRIIEDPDNGGDDFVGLNLMDHMCLNTERGLQTVTVHPNFKENGWVYLYYNVFKEGCLADDSLNGPWNVLARFKMDPNTLEMKYEDREELWRGAPLRKDVHNGGGMMFGNDGKLWLAIGDSGENTLGSQLGITHGKLIRLNDDGTTPDDNPYTKSNGFDAYHCGTNELAGTVPPDASDDAVCSEIWARGLRNPFRMSLDPNVNERTLLKISDVGNKMWEEINNGGTDYRSAHYGYNKYEGPCERGSFVACSVPPEYQDPFHYYLHNKTENGGGCVAGNAVVPDGIGWPDKYKFLFIDYVFLHIYSLFEEPEIECRDCIPPVSAYRNESFYESIPIPGAHKNEARMLDMFFGPYKDTHALYVIRYGRHENVFRIRYTGIANEPPVVAFSFDDRLYEVGTPVQFDASATMDPEGDELTFAWDFGDGGTSADITPTHVYEAPGQYKVTLIVRDEYDQEQQKSETVVIGKPPTVNIILPAEGQQFAVGDILRLKGEAFHENGDAFADSQLLWEVRKHHADHWHPFLEPFEGNDFDLHPAPEPEDYFASTNSYLEIILYAIDENGLTGEVNRLVQPMMVSVLIDTSPSGMEFAVDSEPLFGLTLVDSWRNHEMLLEAVDQPPITFLIWSDGETSPKRNVLLNESKSFFAAFYCVDEGGSCDGSNAVERDFLVLNSELVCCEGKCNATGFCESSSAPESSSDPEPSLAPLDTAVNASRTTSTSPDDNDKSLSAGGGKIGISVLVIGAVAAGVSFLVV